MGVSSSTVVRAELIDLIRQQLLGPRGDAEEEIPGTPRAAYAVGGLAPVTIDPGLARMESEQDDDAEYDPETATSAINDMDPENQPQPGVPVPSDEAISTADSEDDEDEGPKGASTHPSSMGLRFQVPLDAPRLRVTAGWGRYAPFQKTNEETGRKRTWSRRTPYLVTREIEVSGTTSRTHFSVELDDDVSLRVEIFPRDDRHIVELALSNDRVTGVDAPPRDWLFQTELTVDGIDGSPCFLPSRDVLDPGYAEFDPERRRLDLQYKHKLEYAVGRTCSATWDEETGRRRARRVSTTWLPLADVPQTVAGDAGDTVVSMRLLAEAEATELRAALGPLIAGYNDWLVEQDRTAEELPAHLRDTANEAIAEAREAAGRLEIGLALLEKDEDALRAFRFMNRAMRDQRMRSQVAGARAAAEGISVDAALAEVEAKGDAAASWRPFQLAFILMQLPALVRPQDDYRSGDASRVELLFFPTGGGKTEAYLGLAAFTFAIRRLQGVLSTEDGELDGGGGVAVLMRYTLRLLTSQQFQRAAALVCATELIRKEDPGTWGLEPFRIGLWVGSSVSPKRFAEAQAQVQSVKSDDSGRAHGLTVLQVKRCPWCGTLIDPKRDVDAVSTTQRIHVFCGDRSGDCPFSQEGSVDGGLPILTVDEEIYRHPPTFLLATVDKFARLAREGEGASIFGYVAERCPRHGYRHPDARGDACKTASHQTVNRGGVSYPPVTVQAVSRLRPPDLIIQDELHLITGALGTAVGVFENVVDTLCSWDQAGKPVQPLIVASTATVRNAEEQVRNLYGRGVDVFPPQVLDVRKTFFSRELAVTPEQPGRKYLGICAHGIRLTLAEIRVSEVLLLAGQKLLDEHGQAADPYMTTVGYFSATRELAGMRRYLDDDVTTRVAGKTEPFPKRTNDFARLQIGELTSRISSADIASTLDKLALEFDAKRWSTRGKAGFAQAMKEAREKKTAPPAYGDRPFDVVLATSMLQVGVDVPRLGLMLVVGQPKNTAEYIQASSRVGRDPSRPGLVVSLANWARPRDMAHFEQFRHYHETFYAQVEALSVTPYSEAALERGLMGVLISASRVMDVGAQDSLSPEAGAGRVLTQGQRVDRVIKLLADRASRAGLSPDTRQRVEGKLIQRRDRWYDRAHEESGGLVYERSTDSNQITRPLLVSPENRVTTPNDKVFVVANSMREVQPEINVLVSPSPDRLAAKEPVDAPAWTFPTPGDEA